MAASNSKVFKTSKPFVCGPVGPFYSIPRKATQDEYLSDSLPLSRWAVTPVLVTFRGLSQEIVENREQSADIGCYDAMIYATHVEAPHLLLERSQYSLIDP